ncbi:hypothetical protein JFY47_02250 [Enterobacter asburiae]|jgi:hypothetical protein|uniref:hypothetical protein n=1 Tax=Enterobacter asburiae TaxID=61645 RepID=UPI0018E9FD0D|nr:hypothetical protein [Enterobacter asburiae]MBJ3779349.1 hypothetical protein [Enterobacter asburiae]
MPKNLIHIDKIAADFSHLVEADRNHALYLSLVGGVEVAHDVRELVLPPGYKLVRVDRRLDVPQEHFELALLNEVTEEVVYYNRVVTHNDRALNCRPVSQVLVWRTRKPQHNVVLAGIPAKLFFGYLIERYDVVVSDVNQTNEGMSFWLARMYEALGYGLNVYAYDVMSGELKTIGAEDDVGKYQMWLWGDVDNYQHRLAIISRLELPLP